MNSKITDNCFREFDDISPQKKDPSVHILYEYEKYYMELLKKYKSEVEFIQDLIDKHTAEMTEFYSVTLPEISKKLNEDVAIDDDMKKLWLKKIESNMQRSFDLSERLINDFAIKKLDEFKAAVNEKIQGL